MGERSAVDQQNTSGRITWRVMLRGEGEVVVGLPEIKSLGRNFLLWER